LPFSRASSAGPSPIGPDVGAQPLRLFRKRLGPIRKAALSRSSRYDEETKQGLNLTRRYALHCARDHWAVRAARAGTPIAVIQAQLGPGSPMLTLTKYGRFLPSTADRAKWEEAANRYEEARRAQSVK
jgi:hypothetical protein